MIRVEDILRDSSDDSSDEDDDDGEKKKKIGGSGGGGKQKRKGLSRLQESRDDDPLDLLDPMAIKRIVALKGKDKKKTAERENAGFKIETKSGKLIIDDAMLNDAASVRSKKSTATKNKLHLEDMMDTLSIDKKSRYSSMSKSTNAPKHQQQQQKKKKAADDDLDDSDNEQPMDRVSMSSRKSSKIAYKAGGSGIHRDLNRDAAKASINLYKSKVMSIFFVRFF